MRHRPIDFNDPLSEERKGIYVLTNFNKIQQYLKLVLTKF
jgi:hypothetical protein